MDEVEGAMTNYNLFRRADRPELICAVPENRPVPAFIRGPPWDFVGRVRDRAIGSLRCNHEAAAASVRYNGFYLFQLINASDLQLCVDQERAKCPVDEAAARNKKGYQAAATVSWRLLAEIDQSSDSLPARTRVPDRARVSEKMDSRA
jgi:hypothetical protein